MLIAGLVAMSKRGQDKRIGANSAYILVAFLLLLLLEKSAARSVDIRQGMLNQSGRKCGVVGELEVVSGLLS